MTETLPRPADLRPALAWTALAAVGLCWGTGQLLSKLATSTGHNAVGLAFWQTVIGVALFTAGLLATGRRLPLGRREVAFYAVCGLVGTALPHTLSFTAIRHLPVGVQSIVVSLVPMMTLLLSLPLGLDRAQPIRMLGLAMGLVAVVMIVAPGSSLPEPGQAGWVLLLVLVPLSYAVENVVIARARPRNMDSLTVMCGLTWGALFLVTPAMLAADGWVALWPVGMAELSLVGTSILHVLAYFGLVWLIGRAGPVFASQVSYVVTGTGVALGMLVLGERHSLWVWAALALMVAGLALVKPRRTGDAEGG